jgi:hypothetical protein
LRVLRRVGPRMPKEAERVLQTQARQGKSSRSKAMRSTAVPKLGGGGRSARG